VSSPGAAPSLPHPRPSAPVVPRLRWVVLAAALAVVIWAMASTDGFFSSANGKAILASCGTIGLVAIGMTLVVIGGNLFTLALAPTLALSGMIFISSLDLGWPLAALLALAAGAGAGILQGIAVGPARANPIFVTLAATSLLKALIPTIAGGAASAGEDDSFRFLAETIAGVPLTVYVLAVVAIALIWVCNRTTFGRDLYLVGSSRPAARAAGLPVGRVTIIAFTIAALCAAVAGILLSATNSSASISLEGTVTFDVFAAVLVGGTALNGGSGSVWQTLLGTLAIAIVDDLLLLRGYSSEVQTLILGVIVFAMIALAQPKASAR
jgi:ribose/xylose/arabinose/galactoside ABC-type transport system permease subunit